MKINITLLILLLPLAVIAETFSFIPPIERADNTPLLPNEIKHYRIFVNGVYKGTINKDVNPFSLKLKPGINKVTMKTVDTEDRKSDISNEAIVTTLANPNPPVMQ